MEIRYFFYEEESPEQTSFGAAGETRTRDPRVKSSLLYQLSYNRIYYTFYVDTRARIGNLKLATALAFMILFSPYPQTVLVRRRGLEPRTFRLRICYSTN